MMQNNQQEFKKEKEKEVKAESEDELNCQESNSGLKSRSEDSGETSCYFDSGGNSDLQTFSSSNSNFVKGLSTNKVKESLVDKTNSYNYIEPLEIGKVRAPNSAEETYLADGVASGSKSFSRSNLVPDGTGLNEIVRGMSSESDLGNFMEMVDSYKQEEPGSFISGQGASVADDLDKSPIVLSSSGLISDSVSAGRASADPMDLDSSMDNSGQPPTKEAESSNEGESEDVTSEDSNALKTYVVRNLF